MSTFLKSISPYWLWALLSVPAAVILSDALTSDNARIMHILVHPTGETSARLLIITMMATPLTLLFKGWRGPLWLKKNRRYFGVAAFAYALLHTVFYMIDKSTLERMLTELPRLYIWSGWLALAIFTPLAATSMDYFVRHMGTAWKQLQRWTYAATILTLVHWAALHDWGNPTGPIVHFAPLAALEAYRIWYWYGRPRKRASVA